MNPSFYLNKTRSRTTPTQQNTPDLATFRMLVRESVHHDFEKCSSTSNYRTAVDQTKCGMNPRQVHIARNTGFATNDAGNATDEHGSGRVFVDTCRHWPPWRQCIITQVDYV